MIKSVKVGLYNILSRKKMMLNTLSDRVNSVRSTDVVCCCEFNILDLGTVLASSKNGDCISGIMVSVLSSNAVDRGF